MSSQGKKRIDIPKQCLRLTATNLIREEDIMADEGGDDVIHSQHQALDAEGGEVYERVADNLVGPVEGLSIRRY